MSNIDICQELHQNFIDFAYEANSQRAFPDVRDGLKPGQRACLWEFFEKGYTSNKPHVKSAKVSGGVIATWWPHGDVAVYETFARMSQPWINNIPEVDWHGANGNVVIGSAPASSRYTEARLAKPIEEGMFGGIKKNNVPMILNFSEDEKWPEVLPALFPRLFVNGSMGIGVTIAQTWIPNNLNEFVKELKSYITTGEIDYNNLAPDFPSGGIIVNKNELPEIYKTGKGRVVLRARTEIKGKTILITEFPYQVYIEPFINSVKELVESGEINGIKDILNKSDKKRILVEIECQDNPQFVLNKLFAATDLQKTISANQFALLGKTPKLFNLKEYMDAYYNHNLECIVNETNFDLAKDRARLEIVNGLLIALEDIDNVIETIKKSKDASDAVANLQKKYNLTLNQAKAIVDMRLGKLANLERIALHNEAQELSDNITKYLELINSKELLSKEFFNRLDDFAKKYGYKRHTEVIQLAALSKEEKEIVNVEPEKCVVVMTQSGLIKRVPVTAFKVQKRNGVGVKTQDDITDSIIRTNTIDSLMIFSNKGKMYRLLVNDIPEGTNATKGQYVSSLVEMDADERPAAIYSQYRDTDLKYVLFVSKKGLVKKTSLEEYNKTKKKTGLIALTIRDDDELADVSIVKDEDILLITEKGMVIRFKGDQVAAMSRTSSGIKGINLNDGDSVIAALPIRDVSDGLALFTYNGFGKKVPVKDILIQNRGGKGLCFFKPTKISGDIKAASLINDEDNLLLVGEQNSICISAKDVPEQSRTASGLMMLKKGALTSMSKI